MKVKKTLHTILNIVLFGAIWGLLEATAGYLFHWLPGMVSGAIMVPIGSVLMFWGYKNTGKRTAIIYIAIIAAAIKAVNFAMPLPPIGPIKIYNPMISIIIESLVVYSVSFLFERKTSSAKSTLMQVGSLALVIVGWRALFLANLGISFAITGKLDVQLQSLQNALSFVFYNGMFEFFILGLFYVVYRLGSYLLATNNIRIKSPNWLTYILSPLTLIGAVLAVILL